VVEKNLNRLTVFAGLVWAICIVGIGILLKIKLSGSAVPAPDLAGSRHRSHPRPMASRYRRCPHRDLRPG
jgi:hypothetical protein